MKIQDQSYTLPNMNAESPKRDKTLEKIAAAVEMGMEDSASRSIATMLQSDVSALSQGLMNANDATAMMQIAGGAVNSLSDQTQRLNDLSVRYNSASMNDEQKNALRSEFSRMTQSMQQTIETAAFNGQQLFGTNPTFSLGEGSVSASLPALSPAGVSIDSQESIETYRESLNRAYSDIGSTMNALSSSSNAILGQISSTAAAKSQLSDTDMANAVKEFQQSTMKLDMAQIVMAHQNDVLRQNVTRLLG